ncbi:hypothetical protein EPUS_01880 [Endocarpon pusillum Z07020]|uniref:Uncharacterized protein n=1 Tax=Endocarpon pusillum (strain Z07020 / HMAS-L-300199) TaxID=1263415 RepID=U1HHB2_ENDPU|nr:uncharacterized protein EPUS_01880 [Endocarpon pusillum Z07020]ERF69550.1 hypothetical protein EPUS_01880 [Endocarpon pusillum Z07020]
MALTAGDVEADIHYLSRSDIYKSVKPYTLRYKPPGLLPISNVIREKECTIIRNMRHHWDALKYDSCGFQVVELDTQMTFDDFSDVDKIDRVHRPEIEKCVKRTMQASSVQVLDYVIRRRHVSFPIATGEPYEWQQPASRAHIDFTFNAGVSTIRNAFNEKADAILAARWQFVNIWHPLKGPLVDWPLAFCDAASVDFDNDTMAGDVVERTKAFENTQVHFNPQQKWYYLKDQLPSELLMFKNADSESTSGATTGRLVCGNQKSRRFLLIDIRSSSRLILQSTGFTNRDATRKH